MKIIYDNKVIKRIIPSSLLFLMMLFVFLSLFVVKNKNMTIFEKIIEGNIDVVSIVFGILLLLEEVIFLIGILISAIKNKKYYIFFLIGLVYTIVMFSMGIGMKLFSGGHIVLFIFNLVFSILGLVYYYIGKLKYGIDENNNINDNSSYDKKYLKKLRIINILNIIELISALLIFFIPLSTFEFENKITCILIKGIFGSKNLYEIIPCLILIVIYIFALNHYFNVFKLYKCKSKNYLKASKRFANFIFVIIIIFFMTGVIGANIISSILEVKKVTTYSYIPFLVFIPIIITHGILIGSVGYDDENRKLSNRKVKWAIFTFVTIFTLITFLSLFLSIISISNNDNEISSIFVPNYTITPWDLLTKTNKEDSFYVLSFFVLAIVIISAILYILSVTAIFSKSKEAKRIGLASIFANFIFIVVMGLFGKYYEISFLITKDKIISYLNTKYPIVNLTNIQNPTVSSQIFLLIFIDTIIVIILLILKPFTKSDDELLGSVTLDSSEPIKIQTDDNINDKEQTTEDKKSDSIIIDFDACPSFTELDLEKEKFEEEMNIKRTKLFENPSLPSLITFIVDYARESRLHLSYTVESIASFVAGLGATKLTILQGMSGTGKTSLPKIFLEALMGNCEIIEVESSWKDKNELLGYYNEFSKIYTPKKFTRALYKSSLNPSVITFIVLDEMNLSRIEYYFSDFLSLMEDEPDNRKIQLTNIKIYRLEDSIKKSYLGLKNDHTLFIPRNVWFIGTANRDESTFEISDKVYDRAHTMNFNKRAPKVRNYSQEIDQKFLNYETFEKLLDDAINSSDFDLESVSYIKDVEEILRPYNISFGNRILNQIEKYVKIYSACFNNDIDATNEAIEDILLSKVVAKLEFKAIEDKEELVRKFEKLKLYKCSEFVKRLSEDI